MSVFLFVPVLVFVLVYVFVFVFVYGCVCISGCACNCVRASVLTCAKFALVFVSLCLRL